MRFVEPATDSGAIYVNPLTVAYVKPNEPARLTRRSPALPAGDGAAPRALFVRRARGRAAPERAFSLIYPFRRIRSARAVRSN